MKGRGKDNNRSDNIWSFNCGGSVFVARALDLWLKGLNRKKHLLEGVGWIALSLLTLAASAPGEEVVRRPWRVPARKARAANPVLNNGAALSAGEQVYSRECASCHGASGRGDGPGAKEINGGMRTFQEPGLAVQSDGALFYKILSGRKPMPSYRRLLGEQEIWQTVLYLRELAPPRLCEPFFKASAEQRKSVSSVLTEYAATTLALASDDVTGASRCAAELADASDVLVNMAVIPESQRESWRVDCSALAKASRELANLGSLPAQRHAYKRLSGAMCQLVDDFGHAESKPLRLLQHADRDQPRTWLQMDPAVSDPYQAVDPDDVARVARHLAGRPKLPPDARSIVEGEAEK